MAQKKATTKKKGVKSTFITKVILLAALVFVGVQVWLLHGKITEAKAEEAALAAQISAQQQENDSLRRQLEGANDPALIEEIARDDGMVKPGEKVFYDVSN